MEGRNARKKLMETSAIVILSNRCHMWIYKQKGNGIYKTAAHNYHIFIAIYCVIQFSIYVSMFQ